MTQRSSAEVDPIKTTKWEFGPKPRFHNKLYKTIVESTGKALIKTCSRTRNSKKQSGESNQLSTE